MKKIIHQKIFKKRWSSHEVKREKTQKRRKRRMSKKFKILGKIKEKSKLNIKGKKIFRQCRSEM